MLEDLVKQIKERIQRDMKEKFGLSEAESEQSAHILARRIRDFFAESARGNFEQIRDFFDGSGENPLREKFNRETLQELIQKVGLSEETAARVKDFSFETAAAEMRQRFRGMEGRFDLSSFIEKIRSAPVEENAREWVDQVSRFFRTK